MGALLSDLKFAVRTLRREPGFAAAAVLSLALGIGANTAIFSIVNTVLLRPLAFRDPDRLVSVREVVPSISHIYPSVPVNAQHMLEWRKSCPSFEGIAAFRPATANLTGAGEPEQLDAIRVSANLLGLLGVQPRLGRNFLPQEDQPGQDRVAIISDSLWRRRFNADPSIAGKSILLDGAAHVVVGVLPAGFRFIKGRAIDVGGAFSERLDVVKPLPFTKDDLAPMGNFNFGAIARLRPGATPARALAELNAVQANLARAVPEKVELRASVTLLREDIVGDARLSLMVLLGAVGAVLLIVCVNLANLMLARLERKGRDAAVRTALGATRARLIGQTLAECLLISGVGGALGIAAAAVAVRALVNTAPVDLPRLSEISLDPWVLAFGIGISTLTGLLFGVLPAWRMAHTDPHEALKAGGRGGSATLSGMRLRGALIAVEAGLSAMLLITAGLLLSSFGRLMRVNKGFDAPMVLAADVSLPPTKYSDTKDRAAFEQRVAAAMQAQAGVLAAGFATALPLEGETWIDLVSVEGDTRPMWDRPMANMRSATPDYLRTMGIPIRRGRPFSDGDRGRSVAVISERMAERLWPGQDAVGKNIVRNGRTRFEVIGVAGDVRASLHATPPSTVYLPYWEMNRTRLTLVARSAGDPHALAGAMRSAVWSIDRDVPISNTRTMREVLEGSVGQRRFQVKLATAFALSALLLACLGIYGVVSYSVARRTGEMGIRMAFGARASDLHGMVLWQGMRPVAIGLAAGVAGALALGRVLASLLFEVSARDPLTIGAVAALLLGIAALACYVPARRASRVSPMTALRYE